MKLRCSHCGGDVPIEEDSDFVSCSFCGVDLYVETDQTVRHYRLDYQVEERACRPYLKKHLSEMEIRDEIEIDFVRKEYFPYWTFENLGRKKNMICATNVPVGDMTTREMPPVKIRTIKEEKTEKEDKNETRKSIEQALAEFKGNLDVELPQEIKAALIETPFYEVGYTHLGKSYRALVDGITGETYGEEWPTSPQGVKDRVLGAFAIATCAVFTLEAALISSLWMNLIAYGITGAIAYHLTKKLIERIG